MQAHGGRIELTPQPKGTCFRVHLPIEAEVDAGRLGRVDERRERSDGPAGTARHERKGPRP